VKKSDADIQTILTPTQRLINKAGNPQLSLQTLVNTAPNNPIFNSFVDVTNGQTEMEIEDAEDENLQIDSLFTDNSSSSSSGSSSGICADFGAPKKKFKVYNPQDEDDGLINNLIQSNYDNINNDQSAISSGIPSSYINPAQLNPNLVNPI
jgi:hypothetical protein